MLILSIFGDVNNYTFVLYYLSTSLSLCIVQTHQASSLTPFSSVKMVDKHDRDLREPKFEKFPGGMHPKPLRGWCLWC